MEELVQEINEYVEVLSPGLNPDDKVVKMLLNRTKVYLNRKDIPLVLASVIAEILVERNKMATKDAEDTVSSISDNGQTISFSNKTVQSMVSNSDVELFGSHTAILNRFRKVGVLYVFFDFEHKKTH